MKQTLRDINVKYDEAIPIMCDNTSTINISKNMMMQSMTKHISIRNHLLREKVEEKEVILEYVPNKE